MDWFRCASLLVFLLNIDGGFGKIFYNTYPKGQVSRAMPFIPKVISKTCLLKPQSGPCRGNIDMFYFNPSEMNCSIFQWGGCQGNGNRFDTYQGCLDSCLSQPGRIMRPNYCNLRWDFGFCFGDDPRWYYDPKWRICKTSIYSGCGGNRNNFYSREQCDSVCKYGNSPITEGTKEPPRHKAIIINPLDTTIARSINQPTPPPTTTKGASKTCQ